MTRRAGFLKNRDGVTAVFAAILIVPVVLFVGVAIDYTRIAAVHNDLQAEVDAATFEVIRPGSKAYLSALKQDPGEINLPGSTTKEVLDRLEAQLDGGSIVDLSVTASRASTTIRSNIEAEASVDLAFGGLYGYDTQIVAVNSQAEAPLPRFIDFTMMLDISQSMGLAATSDGQTKLKKLTGCAFGCHDKRNASSKDTADLATTNGIAMRIDVLKSAVKELLDEATTNRTEDNQYRFAVYGFDDKFKTVQALTGDTSTVSTKVDELRMKDVTLPTNYTETNYRDTIPQLEKKIPSQGTGDTSKSPLQVAFIITDGVENWWASNNKRRVNAIDPAVCNSMKDRNVIVAVLYTRYLPMTDNTYVSLVKPFEADIPKNLKACASSGYYLEASTPEEIKAAFVQLFRLATDTLRLSN